MVRSKRLQNRDSSILLAQQNRSAVGFANLYRLPDPSSLRVCFLLNDLFVKPDVRRCGAGGALLRASVELASAEAGSHVTLRTAVDNTTAQSAYIQPRAEIEGPS